MFDWYDIRNLLIFYKEVSMSVAQPKSLFELEAISSIKGLSEASFEADLMCKGNITDLLKDNSSQKVVINAAHESFRLKNMGGTAGALRDAGVSEIDGKCELVSDSAPKIGLLVNDKRNVAKYLIQKHNEKTSILHIQAPRKGSDIGQERDDRLESLQKTADNIFEAAIKLKNKRTSPFTLYVNAVGSRVFGNTESYEYLLRSYFKNKQQLDAKGVDVKFTYYDPTPQKMSDNQAGWKAAFGKIKKEVLAYDAGADSEKKPLMVSGHSFNESCELLAKNDWCESKSGSNKYTKDIDVTSSVPSEKDSESSEDEEGVVTVTAEVTEEGGINLSSDNMEATVLAALDLMAQDKSLVPDMKSLGEEDRKSYIAAFKSLRSGGKLSLYQNSDSDDGVSKESVVSRFQEAFGDSVESVSSSSSNSQFVSTLSHQPAVLHKMKEVFSKEKCLALWGNLKTDKDKTSPENATTFFSGELGDTVPEEQGCCVLSDLKRLCDNLGNDDVNHDDIIESLSSLYDHTEKKEYIDSLLGIKTQSFLDGYKKKKDLCDNEYKERKFNEHCASKKAFMENMECRAVVNTVQGALREFYLKNPSLSKSIIDIGKIEIQTRRNNTPELGPIYAYVNDEAVLDSDINKLDIKIFHSKDGGHFEAFHENEKTREGFTNDADGRCGYLSIAQHLLIKLDVFAKDDVVGGRCKGSVKHGLMVSDLADILRTKSMEYFSDSENQRDKDALIDSLVNGFSLSENRVEKGIGKKCLTELLVESGSSYLGLES